MGEQPGDVYQGNTSADTAILTIGGQTVSVSFEIRDLLPTYMVTFNVNGHGTVPEQQPVEQGGKIDEPPTPTADGYDFGGWYRDAECTNQWNFGSDTVSGNLTLYAKWTPITYHITYNLDGSSLTLGQSNPENYTLEMESFTLQNPSKGGYTFTGWTEGDSTTPEKSVTIANGTTGGKTYTSHWMLESPVVMLSASKTQAIYGEDIIFTAQIVSHDGVIYNCKLV